MKKEKYLKPEIEVIELEDEAILTSGGEEDAPIVEPIDPIQS